MRVFYPLPPNVEVKNFESSLRTLISFSDKKGDNVSILLSDDESVTFKNCYIGF